MWAWAVLVIAGLFEIVWALALKYSHGFTRFWPSAIGIIFALTSFIMLSYSFKSLPIGTAYAVWVGISTFGIAIIGIALLNSLLSSTILVSLSFSKLQY